MGECSVCDNPRGYVLYYNGRYLCDKCHIAALETELSELRELLGKYGGHYYHCPAQKGKPCLCGFPRALAAALKEKPDD